MKTEQTLYPEYPGKPVFLYLFHGTDRGDAAFVFPVQYRRQRDSGFWQRIFMRGIR